MSATDDGDGDIGHWVKEIERQLCAAAVKRRRRNWRRLRRREGLSNERSTSTDSLAIGRPIKGSERRKNEIPSFLPTQHTSL